MKLNKALYLIITVLSMFCFMASAAWASDSLDDTGLIEDGKTGRANHPPITATLEPMGEPAPEVSPAESEPTQPTEEDVAAAHAFVRSYGWRIGLIVLVLLVMALVVLVQSRRKHGEKHIRR